jgi:N-acetylglucosaminyl-diphospho-decaprenol L-rhamnosyltransferase
VNCSVVVATYNRAPILRRTLERLCSLPGSPPVIVVDNASTDDTRDVVASFGDRVEYVALQRNIGAAARTVGAKTARTALIAFCDDDCWWSAEALQRAARRFAQTPDLGVVNARVLVFGDERLDPACAAMRAGRPYDRGEAIAIEYFMAGAAIIRRNAFLQAGGYHARYHIGAEESLLSLDLSARGWRLWYCDDVVLYHYPSSLCRAPAERRRLALRNRLWTIWLRRSARTALRATGSYIGRAQRDPIVRVALYEAIRGLPWVVRERRPISRELERRVEAIAASAFD